VPGVPGWPPPRATEATAIAVMVVSHPASV